MLVLGCACVREGQVLEEVLGRLLVLLLADDDVRVVGILALGRLESWDLGDELARVLRLLDSLAGPCSLERRVSTMYHGLGEKRERTHPGSVLSNSFGA